MEIKGILAVLVSVVGTSITFVLGDWDLALTVLVVVMGLDFVSGILRAVHEGTLSSVRGRKGVIKKFGLLLVVVLANLMDMLFAVGDPVFRTLAVYFYIAIEGISFLENLHAVDVLIPKKLKEKLEQILGEVEGQDEVQEDKDEEDVG